jgi:hypothetical protein
VPLSLLLPIRFGVIGALYSGLVADIIVFVITVIIMRHVMKTTLREA